MKNRQSFSVRPGLDAHQELAVAVIRQALLDATNPCAASRVRDGARAFLAGSPMLREWCGVAGLDPVWCSRCAAKASKDDRI
jgi:hypothetical protein